MANSLTRPWMCLTVLFTSLWGQVAFPTLHPFPAQPGKLQGFARSFPYAKSCTGCWGQMHCSSSMACFWTFSARQLALIKAWGRRCSP